jgi:putative membrane-bound dehydrogenase-like protein
MRRTFLALLFALVAAMPAPAQYRVGVARTDITPDHPIRQNGFGGRRAESDGVYQKIHARGLAIDDGSKSPVVLLTVDVLGMPENLYDELAKRLEKKAGVKKERLAVAATHTHTGPMLTGANPTLFGVPIPKEHQANIDKYTPVFLDKLEATALAALKDLKPATLEWGVGSASFAMNRRTKGGPIDHDLPVLIVRDEKRAVRAVYLNYACHCVTLSHNKIGGDWAGYAASSVEEMFPGAVGLVAIGCGADQNPNSGVTGGKEDVALAQGREIAAEVRRLERNFLAPVTGTITAKTTQFDLPLAALPTRKEWEEKAKRMDAIGHHARVTLAKLDRGEKLPTSIPCPVQTWAFGDSLAMVHLPGEVVVDYSLRLKRELDIRRLWVTAYANHAPCYIPSERVLKEGGYEGGGAMIYYDQPSVFAAGLEDKIVAAVKDHLGKSFPPTFDSAKTGGTRPLSPQQSHAALQTKANLKIDLVAAEPFVADPVFIAFGRDGKLWAVEMTDYPTGRTGKFDAGGRIVFLEDTDGDGRFDKSTVFLDNVPFPTGVLPWRKGVLICAAPDILYAEDTNGDGKADVVTKLYSGFGTGNYHGRVNGLQYGLDGWVYGSCGLFGGNIVCHKTGKTVALGDRDFRIKPDTGELEPATGRTQQGRVRDDRGRWFGCDNSNVLYHHALTDHELKRNPFVAYPGGTVNLMPSNRVFSRKADAQRFALSGPANTVTAACGLGIYRDELLGAEFAGDAFTCETVNLLVHRLKLKPSGTTFTAARATDEADGEFLTSTDGWFRPTQAVTGPDGGLWVPDMYRFLIEHPVWIPATDLAKIDVRAGAGMGRIYRVRPADAPLRPWVRLDKLDATDLVAALDTQNGWQRDMATMLLTWRNDPAAVKPLLKLLAESDRGLTRLHALCVLGLMEAIPSDALAWSLLDPDPAVRENAVRLAAPRLTSGEPLTTRLAYMADDPDPHVRRQLAVTLGSSSHPDAGKILARLARTSTDRYYLAAITSSLNANTLIPFAEAVISGSGTGGPPAAVIRDVLATAAGVDGGKQLPKLLALVTKPDGNAFQPWQLAAMAGALDSMDRLGLTGSPAVEQAVEPVISFARKQCETAAANETDRLAALQLLGRDATNRDADLKRLVSLLGPNHPTAVQTAAVNVLARIPDPGVPARLIAVWKDGTPNLRQLVLDTLLARPAWHKELLAAVEAGTIPPGQIDAARRQRLTESKVAAIRKRAEVAFAGGTDPNRMKVIDEYTAGLKMQGNATNGKAVFARVCAACHVLDGVGHTVGPDLAALANKSAAYLLAEILDPNRNLDSRYVEYQAVRADGRTAVGVLAAETATAVTLRGQQAKEETILRADLESLRGSAKSLMPEGLEKDVPKEEMADLLAYLTATAPPHKTLPGNTPAEVAVSDNALTLPAKSARIVGGAITFEPEFGNVGYWAAETDHATWTVRLDQPRSFDVYLDYSCATDSAGNKFAIDGVDAPLKGVVASTGGWDQYRLKKLGSVKLPAGVGRITVRPDGPVRNALFDLRTVYLVPVGSQPKQPGSAESNLPPAELAKLILDEQTPKDQRERCVTAAVTNAPDVIRAMTADLKPDDAKEEYRRIPWIWRVAIAAGRADDAKTLRGLLGVSLPKPDGPLADWQAVVLGGGVINGLSLEGKWPAPRVAELIGKDAELTKRWAVCLKKSHAMADDEKVPTGTRYDALRIVPLDDWKAAKQRLSKYLAKSAHAELQMGAVSGLVDVNQPEATTLLVQALPDLAAGNRSLAVAGLLRTPARITALLDAIDKGGAKVEWVEKPQRAILLEHPDRDIRSRATKLFAAR